MRVWITVQDLAKEGHMGPDSIYQLARREEDPLPLRYLPGDRYGRILVSEFESWWKRNAETRGETIWRGKAAG